MRISTRKFSVQTMIVQKQLNDVEYFGSVGRLVTSDARCTHEIAFRFTIAQEEESFHQRIGFQIKEGTSKVL